MKKNILILFFYIFLVVNIYLPIIDNHHLPIFIDYANAVGILTQAKQAILAAGFPLRIAPWEHNAWLYPEFQFYCPLFYTLAGYIHTYFIQNNPFLVLKITMGLGLTVGVFYWYLLIRFLLQNAYIALLSGVVYLFSPYLLFNIDVRVSFGQAFGMSLIPMVLYYLMRLCCTEKNNASVLYYFLMSAFSAALLAMAHLLTAVTTAVFFSLFFLSCSLIEKKYRKIVVLFSSGIAGFLLSAWYLIPIILYSSILEIASEINAHISPANMLYLTHLPFLFSTRASALVWNILFTPKGISVLNTGIGFVAWLGVLYWCYFFLTGKPHTLFLKNGNTPILKIVCCLFFFALFIAWSPIDFWSILPRFFWNIQSPDRLLIQTMWPGTLLFAYAVHHIYKGRFNQKDFFILFFLIVFSGTQWFTLSTKNQTPISTIIQSPEIGYGANDYMVSIKNIPELAYFPNLLSIFDTVSQCHLVHLTQTCDLQLVQAHSVQLPVLYYPHMLKIIANGKELPYFPSGFMGDNFILPSITLPAGQYHITAQFVGLPWANSISSYSWILFLLAFILQFFERKYRKPMPCKII